MLTYKCSLISYNLTEGPLRGLLPLNKRLLQGPQHHLSKQPLDLDVNPNF